MNCSEVGTGRSALVLAMFFSAALIRVGTAAAQDEGPVEKINAEAAVAEITVTPVRGGIHVLMGSGGNITVQSGADGKLLADAGNLCVA